MHQIEEIELFSSLSQDKLTLIKDNTIIRHYSGNSILFYEGDTPKYMHILLEGNVKLCKTAKNGKNIYVHSIKSPSSIALYPSIEDSNFPATCEFIDNGTIGLLPIDILKSLLDDQSFVLACMKQFSKHISLLEEKLELFTIYNAEQKIVYHLVNHLEYFSNYSKSDIAKILNITPETLSRELTKLSKDNIIDCNGSHIQINDEDKLNNILN